MIVQPDFFNHWKTQMLEKQVGQCAALFVLRLWAHCQTRRSGSFSDSEFTPEILAAICRFEGDPVELWTAFVKCRFIQIVEKSVVVHQWEEHNRALFGSWKNGDRNGKKHRNDTQPEPTGYPRVTGGIPADNLNDTCGKPVDDPIDTRPPARDGLDGEESPPLSPTGVLGQMPNAECRIPNVKRSGSNQADTRMAPDPNALSPEEGRKFYESLKKPKPNGAVHAAK